MRKFFIRFCILLLLFLLLPALPLLHDRPKEAENTAKAPSASLTEAAAPAYYRLVKTDSGRVLKITPKEYLKGVAAAELPASFSKDTLIAQMVASHSYALTVMAKDPAQPVLTDDPAKHQGYLTAKERKELYANSFEKQEAFLDEAAQEALSWLLTSDGETILPAVFHSCSSGMTEDAAIVWGSAVPCLTAVKSPDESAPVYRQEFTFSAKEARDLLAKYFPDEDVPMLPVTVTETSPSKTVLTARLGQITCTGQQVREIFSLPSACFTVTSGEGPVTFMTLGQGHGVGMSQYGAEAMAQAGSSWQEILAHYYPGSVLLKISLQDGGI